MLEINGLQKHFEDFEVLNGLEWQVPDASIIGLIGSNGAGKSTLLRCISQVYDDYKGQILYDGQDITKQREHIFFVPDEPFYFNRFSTKAMKGFYKSFYPNFNEEYYQYLLSVFRFNENKPIHNLSKGLKRQCALILALSCKPQLLLMDESFDGLDPMMRLHLKRELIRLVEEEGISVVISSHNIRELEDICDGMALLEQKKIVFTRTLAELNENYHKLQLGYKESPDPSFFHSLPLLSYEHNNKIVTVVFTGDEVRQQLMATNPVLVNPLQISMEEIFVVEMEALSYVR